MSDEVSIWNQALSAIGSRALISSPSEKGREADLCRLHYPIIRDLVLKSASWPCASSWARLALHATRDANAAWTPGPVAPGWRYAYAQPSDLLAPRFLASYNRFAVGQYGGVSLLLANEENAILNYTARVTNVGLFDQGLVNAVVYGLAARLCLPISGKDTRARELRENAVEAVLLARTEIANESELLEESLPSWIQARGLSMVPEQDRFIWSYQAVNVGTF